MNRIELSSSAWKADALAIVLHLQKKKIREKHSDCYQFLKTHFLILEVSLKPLLMYCKK